MRILVSNDDGIYSPGIAALAEVASEFAEVRVVAPDVERSSASHSITSAFPMSYRPTRIGNLAAYRVNGTPADCVALGTHHWDSVDLVLSGLNLGFNLGNAIWHSGTLAAAKQAVLLGVRGVALSVPAGIDQDFEPVKPWIRHGAGRRALLDPSLPLVNVNLPRRGARTPVEDASVGAAVDGRVVPTQDPQGRDLFWFTVKPLEHADEGTDRWAVEQNWISMTAIADRSRQESRPCPTLMTATARRPR